MTKKKQAEILRAARIFNAFDISKATGSPYVTLSSTGSRNDDFRQPAVVYPGKIINPKRENMPFYEKASERLFCGFDKIAALDNAFAYAKTLSGVPRDQWVTSPFDRSTWFPAAVVEAALKIAQDYLAAKES